MKALVSLLCAMALAGCAGSPPLGRGTRFTQQQAIEVFARFERLPPPASSSTARRYLGDESWMARASIFRFNRRLGGYIPLRTDIFPGSSFCVAFTEGRGSSPGYRIWLTTTPNITSEAALRTFFAGTAPESARVIEFALCHPDGTIRSFPAAPHQTPKR